MLRKPFLAKCTDRNLLPKEHPTSGTPDEWFSNDVLVQKAMYGVTFDFFVNWGGSTPQVTPIIWVKRLLQSPHTYTEFLTKLDSNMIQEFGIEYLERIKSFADKYKFHLQFIIYRDDFDWENEISEILIVEIVSTGLSGRTYHSSIVSIEHFKNQIKCYSGGPIRIGSKGLFYGTSRLECYLSATDSLYPGDADLVVLDSMNNVIALLEFKKHTLNTPISEQKLSNYYPYPDGRKYNRLAILNDYLGTIIGSPVPVFIIYYPTNPSSIKGKLELIQGHTGNLSTKAASPFNLPGKRNLEDFSLVVAKLQNGINFFKNNR